MNKPVLTSLDLSILKYYKNGKELSGFEGVHNNLCKMDLLDGDLELTREGWNFLIEYPDWDKVEEYNNEMVLTIKPKL